jgi:hypothetical protein
VVGTQHWPNRYADYLWLPPDETELLDPWFATVRKIAKPWHHFFLVRNVVSLAALRLTDQTARSMTASVGLVARICQAGEKVQSLSKQYGMS